MLDEKKFIEEIEVEGFSVVENALSTEMVKRARLELKKAIDKEESYHGTKEYQDYGMVLLCSLYGGAFTDIFNIEPFIKPFEAILGEGCIVYGYTSSSMPPGAVNYSHRIHVDCPRVIPGYITNMGGIALLDDFNTENGATWMLPRSQERLEPPSEEEFFKNARQITAKAGSAIYFNARVWHMGAPNKTNHWRHALTINMCRPWMKQRMDIPRVMANVDITSLSESAQQKLGFFTQIPASYDEYYVPPGKRKFKQKVE